MQVRIIDLDGAITRQDRLMARLAPAVMPAREWGPRIRLACGFGRFRRFERALAGWCGGGADSGPCWTFVGSGDFHHVSLALVRRQPRPFNLLVVDNHPDWVRAIPFLHCGTWVRHALRSPLLRHVYHVGGDVDFDNRFRRLAPWPELRSGRVRVFPAVREYRRGQWRAVPSYPLRAAPTVPLTAGRVADLLRPFRDELARHPLYVSLDKDVLTADDAPVNWDSGHLRLAEVRAVLTAFLGAARLGLAGLDVVGDWSPVVTRGWLPWLMDRTEHPRLSVDPADATARNERANLSIFEAVTGREVPSGEAA